MRNSVRKRAEKAPVQRQKRIVCLLSDDEAKIIERYLERYKITNRGRWYREVILGFIRSNEENDCPTLFTEHDMRR